MNRQQHIVVISAELPSKGHFDNIARTDRLRGLLNEMHHSHGVFSGFTTAKRFNNLKLEECFIVKLKDEEFETELEVLQGYAKNFGQEAIIHSDSNRHTQLLFEDGAESLGRLVGVTKEEAESEGNYITREVKRKGHVVDTLYYVTKKVQ
jgi:hypothetical protein